MHDPCHSDAQVPVQHGRRRRAHRRALAWSPTPVADRVRRAGARRPPQLNPQLARIAEAVAAERMEVPSRADPRPGGGRPRRFEVSTRLLTADGATLDQSDYARAALGSGLMPRIDAAEMVRAARVAGRLGRRGREGAVLATMAGDSLTDQAFLDAAASGFGNGATMGLVLCFAQVRCAPSRRVMSVRSAVWPRSGFRFALEDVTVSTWTSLPSRRWVSRSWSSMRRCSSTACRLPAGRVPASDLPPWPTSA